MSFLSIARSGLSAIGKNQSVRSAGSFLKKGTTGTLAVGGYGIAATSGYYSYGNKYGDGAGVLMGIGEAAVFDLAIKAGPAGIMLGGIAAGGYFAYQKGREIYKQNRAINMHRPILDNYGTINQMRMQSIQSLSRDRSGIGRTLGHEARYLHR